MQLELTYAREESAHDLQIEAMNCEAFGPARFTRAAHLIREAGGHDMRLSFTALHGGAVVGSLRMTPIVIGKVPALLLGPLVIRPEWKNRGLGGKLINMSINAAKEAGHKIILLVGDEPYYQRFGFRLVGQGEVSMPAPVNPARLLCYEIEADAMKNVRGLVRHASQA